MNTYKENYNKIIEAYFKDEIKPYDQEFCFCGTLCNNNKDWWAKVHCEVHCNNIGFDDYSCRELYEMEKALLLPLAELSEAELSNNIDDADYLLINGEVRKYVIKHEYYEDALFEGMCAALEVLRQIHESRGENIDDEIPAFTKRKLQTA